MRSLETRRRVHWVMTGETRKEAGVERSVLYFATCGGCGHIDMMQNLTRKESERRWRAEGWLLDGVPFCPLCRDQIDVLDWLP